MELCLSTTLSICHLVIYEKRQVGSISAIFKDDCGKKIK